MTFNADSVVHDIRYAVRRLAHAPMFTLVAVIVLASGVGVNTAFFSVVNGVLFRSIDAPNAGRLVRIDRNEPGEARGNSGLPERQLQQLQARHPALIDNFFTLDHFNGAVDIGDSARRVMAEAVSGNFFSVLNLRPLAGRLFGAADDTLGATGTCVISARMWRRDFGADPTLVGRTIRVNGVPLVLVGIAPERFAGMSLPNIIGADVWVPIASIRSYLEAQRIRPETSARDTERIRVDGLTFDVYATLTAGASLSRADREMRAISSGINVREPQQFLTVVNGSRGIVPYQLDNIFASLSAALLAVSGIVLCVACASLSGLMLARVSRRSAEVAVRMAIGASRQRILQMQLMETAILSAAAGAVGLWLAVLLTRAFMQIPVPEIGGFVMQFNAAPDMRAFWCALAVAGAASMMVGWAPAQRMTDVNPLTAWSRAGGSTSVTPRTRNATSRLVAFQFGASLSLMLVATLFVRSAVSASTYDADVDVVHIAGGKPDVQSLNLRSADAQTMFDRIETAAQSAPGIRHAALATGVPLGGSGQLSILRTYGQASSYLAHRVTASPSFFDLFDVKVTRGRLFARSDIAGQSPVAVVNELVAADLWPGKDPIGQSLYVSTTRHRSVTVIGVVKETDRAARVQQDRRFVFVPLAQNIETGGTALFVSGDRDAAELIKAMRTAIASVAPTMALLDAKPLKYFVGLGANGAAIAAGAVGGTGLLGLFIALVGLYGTVAFVVGERTREFGIMRALGAEPAHIRHLVLKDAVRMLVRGLVPGLVATFAAAGFLQSWLLGFSAHDPVTFIVVPIVLFIVGCAAAMIPAYQASRVDPTQAIKNL